MKLKKFFNKIFARHHKKNEEKKITEQHNETVQKNVIAQKNDIVQIQKNDAKQLVVAKKQNEQKHAPKKDVHTKVHNHDADMKALMEIVAPGDFWVKDAEIGFTNANVLLEQFLDTKVLGMVHQFSDGFEFGG